ncbi:MAG TPA: FkbM family methyltransferase [Rubrivivax sp.]|nr:FkbM family methyltransferase [Rubrivivax sp.]
MPLFDGRYELPYCGRLSPFPSDYVLSPWAPFTQPSIRSIFPGSFVDVGSNIGQTMLFIKHCDPDWNYIGFEPNPNCFVVSRQIVEANQLQACVLVPAGLSDRSGLLQLESNFATDPAASLISGFRFEARMKLRSHVTVVRGDEALDQIGCDKVGFLKIDVEGGELEVLRGLRRRLESCRPLIICEVLALHDGNSVGDFRVHRQRELEAILRDHRFSILRIESPTLLRRIAAVPDDGRRELVDYFFVPDERLEGLASALAKLNVTLTQG